MENGREAALSILEISGWLKIFIECRWILRLIVINHHRLVPRLRSVVRDRRILSSQLKVDL
jgi:hypothetical protein